jgi:hypothetical protein
MARIEPEEVEKAVERHMAETDGLRERMEEDYEIYRLTAFDAGEGYQNYTSNAPQTYADKIIGWLGAHELIVRVPHSGDPAEERDQNDAKERLLIGLLRSADASLVEQLVPALKPQLSWYICLRGWYAGRALLVKDEDEGTYVDVTPWDPLHTYWSKGRRGLEWACYKVRRTRDEIESEYPDFDFDEFSSNGRNPDEGGFDVYDYYDRKDNCVVIEGKFAKKPTPHGSNRVGFRNDEADEIIETCRRTFDVEERISLLNRFHAIVHEEQPYTFFFAPREVGAWRSHIQNVSFAPLRPFDYSHSWYVDAN